MKKTEEEKPAEPPASENFSPRSETSSRADLKSDAPEAQRPVGVAPRKKITAIIESGRAPLALGPPQGLRAVFLAGKRFRAGLDGEWRVASYIVYRLVHAPGLRTIPCLKPNTMRTRA